MMSRVYCASSFLVISYTLPFTKERLVTLATVRHPHMTGYLLLEQQDR